MKQRGSNRAVIPSNVEGSRLISRHSRAGGNPESRYNGLMGPRIECEDLNTRGFTLVELAIALMVIGLLIGGVLKGQELIENARMTRMIKDIADYETAVMIFRNTYNELPGDMRRPERLPNCNAAPCNIIAASAGNGQIFGHAKSAQFWRHLFHAGLIANINEDPDNPDNFLGISPLNSFGYNSSVYYIQRDPAGTDQSNRYFPSDRISISIPSVSISGIAIKRAAQLDEKLDDRNPRTGKVQAQEPTSHAYISAQCYDTDTPSQYRRDNAGLRCTLGIVSETLN